MQTEFLAELEARHAGWQQTHKRVGRRLGEIVSY
jgi:hypothetical protein